MSQITRPKLIGLRSLDRLVSFDLRRDTLEIFGPDDELLELPREDRENLFRDLIRAWEATRIESGERALPAVSAAPPGAA